MLSGIKIWFLQSSFSHSPLLGRPLCDYLTREFSGLDCEIVPKNANPEAGGGGRVEVFIPLNMPLVRVKDVSYAIESMRRRKLGSLSLGGKDSPARISIDGEPPNGYFLSGASFLKVEGAKSYHKVYNQMKERIIERLLLSEVNIPDAYGVTVDDTAIVSPGAVVLPMSRIVGATEIGCGAIVESSYLEDCIIKDGANVIMSHLVGSRVGARTSVGPFARLRGATVGEDCRIGDFVEVKGSQLGDGVKSAHLTYIGDADVGGGTNVGCGTVFCNYDGKNKHRTTVGENCFIGANTNLIAPLKVGDNAFIAAGTTVSRDVEADTFTIGRAAQSSKERRK